MRDEGIPLAVDVDGSLLRSDLLMETLWAALGNDFFKTVMIVLTSIWTPAKLKRRLLEVADIDITLQPVRAEVLVLCQNATRNGRRVVLASGSDQKLVDALAAHLGFSGDHFGSDGVLNLTGSRKSKALVERFGEYNFDYIGNAAPDLKVWKFAHSIIAVTPRARLMRKISGLGRSVEVIGERDGLRPLVNGLRPYQWVKNFLLLLPVLAAHNFEAATLLQVLLGMVSFSAGASAIYIVNDLLDLAADRQHSKKKYRPFAAATVQISTAMATGAGLAIIALLTGWFISWAFVGVVSLYMATSLAYSFRLKRMRWIDIFVLAWLYTVRVLAGSVAASVALSGWLLALAFAAFLSLGAVKRMTELAKATGDAPLPGRGYGRGDMVDLFNISAMAVFTAVVIFLAYTFSPTAIDLYSDPWVLRLMALPITAWLVRMILLGRKGEQDYDPLIFAARDKIGLGLIAMAAALVFVAI